MFGAKYLILVVALASAVFTLLSQRMVRNNILKLAVLSFPIAFLVALIASHFYYDTRPFVAENVEPLIPHAADNGFPSDHTLYAMVAAAIVFAYNRTIGILLVILAILVGVSRVMARVHYPVDIVGSMATAVAATSVGWIILKRVART